MVPTARPSALFATQLGKRYVAVIPKLFLSLVPTNPKDVCPCPVAVRFLFDGFLAKRVEEILWVLDRIPAQDVSCPAPASPHIGALGRREYAGHDLPVIIPVI